jgi:excisionase family DNA binding protein
MSKESIELMAYTVEQAGKAINLHPNSIRKLIAEKNLPAIAIGKKWIIPVQELRVWLRCNISNP